MKEKEWDLYAKDNLSQEGYVLYRLLINFNKELCEYGKKGGIGYRAAIENMLSKYKSEPSEEDIKKSIKKLNILFKFGKFNKEQYDKFVIKAKKHGTIKINEVWIYLNKLNTNVYAVSYLIAHVVDKSMNSKKPHVQTYGMDIYSCIVNDDPINGLTKLLPNFGKLMDSLFNISNECESLNKFVEPIIKLTSADGEKRERTVLNYFIKKGFRIIHIGGNGDFIDIVLGMDFIVYKEGCGCNSIQVKPLTYKGDKRSYYIETGVDWLVRCDDDDLEIRDMLSFDKITLKTELFENGEIIF